MTPTDVHPQGSVAERPELPRDGSGPLPAGGRSPSPVPPGNGTGHGDEPTNTRTPASVAPPAGQSAPSGRGEASRRGAGGYVCGTTRAYRRGCRCASCRAAVAAAERRRYHHRKQHGPMLVDAAPVRAHVVALHEVGIAYGTIAEHAGVTERAVYGLVVGYRGRPPVDRITARNARAILAVEPDLELMRPLARVPAVGTSRRVRALRALGWPYDDLAGELDIARSRVALLGIGAIDYVSVRTALNVRDRYESLASTPGPSARAAHLARRDGCLPPIWWDDDTIDDPSARPNTADGTAPARMVDEIAVQRAADGDDVALNPTERREAVRVLHSRHLNDRQIAARLRIADETAFRIRQRLALPANADNTGNLLGRSA